MNGLTSQVSACQYKFPLQTVVYLLTNSTHTHFVYHSKICRHYCSH